MTVQRLSTLLYWLLLLPVLGIPLMWLFFTLSIGSFKDLAINSVEYNIQWQTVEVWQLYVTGFVLAIPSMILVWGLTRLRVTFRAFAQQKIFEFSNVVNVKHFALALIWAPIINIFVRPLSSVLLSVNHPAGEKVLSVSFNSYDISTFLIGLIFWLIAKILIEANALSQENKAFV